MGAGKDREAKARRPQRELKGTGPSDGSDVPSALADAVAQRVAHRRGVRVAESGVLTEDHGGHQAGTEYVVIAARTLVDCEHAETNLADISRLPDLAWERGWQDGTSRRGWPFHLRIYPAMSAAAAE
jgi:hypothetical protein